jgi:hypothetical protein
MNFIKIELKKYEVVFINDSQFEDLVIKHFIGLRYSGIQELLYRFPELDAVSFDETILAHYDEDRDMFDCSLINDEFKINRFGKCDRTTLFVLSEYDNYNYNYGKNFIVPEYEIGH